MCGFAGIFDTRERRPIDEQLLSRMNDRLSHRGPDDHGLHLEPGVGLGHRRLSIIDLAGGHQPLYNEDDTVGVVYNGEIYNFQELRVELERRGHRFRTHSDTETIVHAWEQWGESCVERFRGMFAFALWDRNRETLFLARDRVGIKPLYYSFLDDGLLVFGSELKALFEHPGLSRTIDPTAVEDFFAYGYVPDPRTILRDTRKLAPGRTLAVRRGAPQPEPRRYWNVRFAAAPAASEAELREQLIEHLREAVRIRLISEVPLGAFLSGGVDSSAVVAMMAGLNSSPVNTCSISFGDPRFNESHYADEVARRYRTNHRMEQVNPDDFDLVDRLAAVYDEPYADSSALPTYRVCELARKFVTVVLSGDGGDESFAGYRRYRWHRYEERVRSVLPAAVRRPLFGALGTLYPKLDWAPRVLRAKSTFESLARNSVEGYFHSVSIVPDRVRRQLFSDRFKSELGGYEAIEVLRSHAGEAPPDDPVALVQYLDFKTYLPGDILTKVDRASMAHGLEVRVPILDHVFLEWACSVPTALKLNGQQGKYLLKKSLEPYVSREILYRPKMGFAVPLASWFRGPLKERVREAALGPTLCDSGIFRPEALRTVVDQHQSGARDNSAILWALLMFDGFRRLVQ